MDWAYLYTQRNLFEFLVNQTEIRMYLPSSDWFRTKRNSLWCQMNRKVVNMIWFRFDLTRFWKDFSLRVSQRREIHISKISVSRHNGGILEAPLNSSVAYCRDVRGVSGAFYCSPWYRETPGPRMAAPHCAGEVSAPKWKCLARRCNRSQLTLSWGNFGKDSLPSLPKYL